MTQGLSTTQHLSQSELGGIRSPLSSPAGNTRLQEDSREGRDPSLRPKAVVLGEDLAGASSCQQSCINTMAWAAHLSIPGPQ